jgi:hypothetical protein
MPARVDRGRMHVALRSALGSKERERCRPIRGECQVAPPVTAHEAYAWHVYGRYL